MTVQKIMQNQFSMEDHKKDYTESLIDESLKEKSSLDLNLTFKSIMMNYCKIQGNIRRKNKLIVTNKPQQHRAQVNLFWHIYKSLLQKKSSTSKKQHDIIDYKAGDYFGQDSACNKENQQIDIT